MKVDFKKWLLHLLAIVIFILVIYVFLPAPFQGKVMNQHDTTSWRAMSKSAFDYKEKNGHFPLWNTHMFSGMPNFMMAMEGKSILPNFGEINKLGLPEPVAFFLIAAICFYILACCFKVNNWIGMGMAILYSLLTYNMVITAAGHQTKMLAIAYMPLVIASMKVMYDKKYGLGLAMSTLSIFFLISANHMQITYYMAFMCAFYVVYKGITMISNKEGKAFFYGSALLLIAAVISILINAGGLMITNEYSKYTMRGGAAVKIENDGKIKDSITKGLDNSYAFQYSHGKAELMTFMMPEAFGGRTPDQYDSENADKDLIGEDSKAVEKIQALDVDDRIKSSVANGIASQPKYWGMVGSTNGPWYVGTITILLCIIAFSIKGIRNKWWLLAAILFGMILGVGENLQTVNNYLFKTIPYLNKFRAPGTALFVTQLAFMILGMFTLNNIVQTTTKNIEAINKFSNNNIFSNGFLKQISLGIGSLLLFLAGYYMFGDFSHPNDKDLLAQLSNPNYGGIGNSVIKALESNRQAMFLSGIWKVFFMSVLVMSGLYAFYRNIINKYILIGTLMFVSIADMFIESKKYISDNRFFEKEAYQSDAFQISNAEKQMMTDTSSNYRVLNLTGGAFSDAMPAYHYKNIGGYNPAKLRIYQDVIEAYLSNPQQNMNVVSMLNTKYFVFKPEGAKEPVVQQNPNAMGNCWFVKNVVIAKSAADELSQLKGRNFKDSAVISKEDGAIFKPFTPDTSGSIKLTQFDADEMIYSSDSKADKFAVFSEVYYPMGWKAYIDEKEAPILKTNYVLRGLQIPSGQHTIKFVFKPETIAKGAKLSMIGSILFYIVVLGGFLWSILLWLKQQKQVSL
jgi:hypothetical protein